MTRDDIVTAARGWRDVRFRHQGRTRDGGVDCLGMGINVAWELNIVPRSYDVQGYERMPDGRLFEECERLLIRIPSPRYGCFAVMKFDTEPQHIAIVGEHRGHLTLIHALSSEKRVVEHRLLAPWPNRIVGCFDAPGVV